MKVQFRINSRFASLLKVFWSAHAHALKMRSPTNPRTRSNTRIPSWMVSRSAAHIPHTIRQVRQILSELGREKRRRFTSGTESLLGTREQDADERPSMSEIVTNLFVYGTWMPGESNYRQIEDFVIDHKPGTIDGVLVDLGAYPALVPGDGHVRGVMLRMHREALEITDRIEGYHPDRDRCLYVRKEVVVQLEDGQESVAWTYFFANTEEIVDRPRLIVGDSDGVPVHAWC